MLDARASRRHALVMLLQIALVVAGCRATAPGAMATARDSTPSETATQTARPTAEPSPSAHDSSPWQTSPPIPTPTLDDTTRPIFQNWALATVQVNGLNVRVDPRADAQLLDDGRVRLNADDHVLVVSDATGADGLWWLRVAVQQPSPFSQVLVGWAAAGTRQEPWIEEDNSWCPSSPDLDALLTLSGIERLGCYGSAPILIQAYQATLAPDAGLGGACSDEPRWLMCDHINYSWVNRDGGYAWEFLLHFDPATGIPETDLAPDGVRRNLRITGHFADDAATECAPDLLATGEDWAGYLSCAVLFVVDQLDVLGS